MQQAGSPPRSGDFNKFWSAGLDAYDAGRCQFAKARFSDVLRMMPDEPDALRLSAQAASCADREGAIGRLLEGINWAILGGAGLMAIA